MGTPVDSCPSRQRLPIWADVCSKFEVTTLQNFSCGGVSGRLTQIEGQEAPLCTTEVLELFVHLRTPVQLPASFRCQVCPPISAALSAQTHLLTTLAISRRHRSRCLGVAIFYSSTHFEKTAELRVVFSQETRDLREDSRREGERSHSSGESELPEAVLAAPTATTTRAGKGAAAPCDQFLRRVYGGDTGRGAKGGQDPATVSRLEQDLANRHDAAALVRLKLKESDDVEEGASGEGGHGGGGEHGRSFTVVCAHLFYDPNRPDLKTAQCQMLFQAVDRLHEKCGVASALGGGKAGSERSSLGPANVVLCADFNSKPLLDPWFLPGPLKVSAGAEEVSLVRLRFRLPASCTPRFQFYFKVCM